MHGTDDIRTSGGYFHMANVFYRQNKLDVAFSLYNQVQQLHRIQNVNKINTVVHVHVDQGDLGSRSLHYIRLEKQGCHALRFQVAGYMQLVGGELNS